MTGAFMSASGLNPSMIGRALFREEFLGSLLREISRDTDIPLSQQDLIEGIRAMLTPEAQAQISPLNLSRKRVVKRAKVHAAPIPDAEHKVIYDRTPPPTPPGELSKS